MALRKRSEDLHRNSRAHIECDHDRAQKIALLSEVMVGPRGRRGVTMRLVWLRPSFRKLHRKIKTKGTEKMKSKSLTLKQAAFAQEYVIDFSAKDAPARAGYSEHTAAQIGYQLLRDQHVRAEIDRLTLQKAERASINADEIVEALAQIVRANIADIIEWGMAPVLKPDGKPAASADGLPIVAPFVRLLDIHKLSMSVLGTVASINVSDKGGVTVKMHNKLNAIEKLMRHLGMFEEKTQQMDGLSLLIASVQGNALPIATRTSSPACMRQDDELN